MSKKIITIGAVVVLVLAVGSYLLLSRESNPSSQNAIPTKPLTTQNADTSFQQTDSVIQTQIDQADQDMNSIDQINTQAPAEDNTSSINSL